MAGIFIPALRAGGNNFPLTANGENVVFYADFQWSRSNYLAAPFAVYAGKLIKSGTVYNLKYNINDRGNKYLEFPDKCFSLGHSAANGRPDCFMFPRWRGAASVFCAKFNAEPYLQANDKAKVTLYKAAGAAEIVEAAFSQFDYPYKFDTLPAADDGTFWGVKYDKAFYGGIKIIA